MRNEAPSNQFTRSGLPIGREEEFHRLLENVTQERGPIHTFLVGERGIGKTTILNALNDTCSSSSEKTDETTLGIVNRLIDGSSKTLRPSAQGQEKALQEIGSWGCIRISLDSEMNPVRLCKLIIYSFSSLLGAGNLFGAIKRYSDNLESFGVGKLATVTVRERASWEYVDRFVFDLCSSVNSLIKRGKISGLVIVLDEVDQVDPKKLAIGQFLKALVEMFASLGQRRIAIVCAGLPSAKDIVLHTHPSAWRLFDVIDVNPLSDSQVRMLAELMIEDIQRAGERVLNLERAVLDEIVRVSEGYPHWLKTYIDVIADEAQSKDQECSNGSTDHSINVNDFDRIKGEAARRIGDNYYYHALKELDGKAIDILLILSLSRQEKVHKQDLSLLAGVDGDQLDQTLTKLEVLGMIVRIDVASRSYFCVRYQALKYWLWMQKWRTGFFDQAEHLDLVKSLSERVRIAAEDLPPFYAFRDLLSVDFGQKMKSLELTSISHPAAFRGLPSHERVVKFQNGIDEILESEIGRLKSDHDYEQRVESCWTDGWGEFDVIAIPHYLLGYAVDKGVWTIQELLDDHNFERSMVWSKHSITCFEDICKFRNVWAAIPYTSICKCVFYKKDSGGVVFDECIDKDSGGFNIYSAAGVAEGGILLEGKKHCVSLWYDVETYLNCISEGDIAIQFLSELGDSNTVNSQYESKLWKEEKFLKGLWQYAELVGCQREELRGKHNWETASASFFGDQRITVYPSWTDSGAEIERKLGPTLGVAPLGLVDASDPKRNLGLAGQPIESWVLVFPRTEGRTEPSDHERKIASILIGTLMPYWQERFAQLTGVSPMQRFLDSMNSSEIKPWTRIQSAVVKENRLRGTGGLQHLRIQTLVSLYSYLVFGESRRFEGDGKLCWSEEEIRRRWEMVRDEFISAMNDIGALELRNV